MFSYYPARTRSMGCGALDMDVKPTCGGHLRFITHHILRIAMSISTRHLLDDNDRAFAIIFRCSQDALALAEVISETVNVEDIEDEIRDAGLNKCALNHHHYAGVSILEENIGEVFVICATDTQYACDKHFTRINSENLERESTKWQEILEARRFANIHTQIMDDMERYEMKAQDAFKMMSKRLIDDLWGGVEALTTDGLHWIAEYHKELEVLLRKSADLRYGINSAIEEVLALYEEPSYYDQFPSLSEPIRQSLDILSNTMLDIATSKVQTSK
ncbi:hypothetical protein SCHPADRAFT_895626 [Schizopora paradoxa]|uniref:Uncharacterized protein n=1 Tax=Schizopora paradoxa TaxID=27342 RepID=A0A0H2R335_9AGAM|nr:hypothetical protein SCHPADRAFT_895626 [Schizopora paradoxa]